VATCSNRCRLKVTSDRVPKVRVGRTARDRSASTVNEAHVARVVAAVVVVATVAKASDRTTHVAKALVRRKAAVDPKAAQRRRKAAS